MHLDAIRAAAAATPPAAIAIAAFLTMVSFATMALYDVIAVRRVVPGRVPTRLAAFAGATGFAISNTLGFHLFVGGPVRYRIYATVGLDAADVGRVVGLAFASTWLGIAAILGAALALDPVGVPVLRRLAPAADRALGFAVLIGLVVLVVWLRRSDRTLTLLRWRVPLPGGPSALVLLVVGGVDIAAASGALFVLLPSDVAPGFAIFVIVFVVAMLAGSASHVPGGLGVFEAAILIGLDAGARPDAIAALVLYRLIYYFAPLAIGGVALAVFEGQQARAPLARASRTALRTVRPFVAPALAGLVFLGGAILMLSGNVPAEGSRIALLRRLVPLPFSEASHLLASLIGLLLLILARGLASRIALARSTAIVLLLGGAAFAMLRGFDWEEALLLTGIAALLFGYRGVFYRKGDWRGFRPTPGWLALVAVTLVSLTLIGVFAFRDVEYRADLWWRFAWSGDAPRFLRATLALAAVAAAVAADALVNRPVQGRVGQVAVPDAVRRILAGCPVTQPQIALLGDKRFLLAESETAFLMYGIVGRSWITMGDPVGEAEAGRELVWRFAETADRAGARAIFYAVPPESLPLYLDLGLAVLKIGEVAQVDLPTFTLEGPARHDSRNALRRAEREGLVFAVVPKAEVPALLPVLREVSDAWLATKKGHEKGFSLGRFDPEYLAEFDCAVVRKDGAVVAFANLWRGADGGEISVDLMRYRPDVSRVLMDMLFTKIILYG
ncbi:MAG: bifunctional lysylphosphatidylglycerol flippase/synthetase MprF, partial [Actinomycetota bacterium]|nr:bifunctional lysylphosphatidylglycerol flippase/synthetase MprF [Actinomycetota bacterium]